MQLQPIDKATYRQRLNRIIAVGIGVLVVVTLGSSTLLIYLIGEPGGSNFGLNIAGLIIACFVLGILIKQYRKHPYMHEAVYVWKLKQALNRIYRNSAKVNAAADKDDHNALIILNFSYQGSKQLYQLDDNDLTMDKLNQDIQQLDDKVARLGLTLHTDDYSPDLLDRII